MLGGVTASELQAGPGDCLPRREQGTLGAGLEDLSTLVFSEGNSKGVLQGCSVT